MKKTSIILLCAITLISLFLPTNGFSADPEIWPTPQKIVVPPQAGNFSAQKLPLETVRKLPPLAETMRLKKITPSGQSSAMNVVNCGGNEQKFAGLMKGKNIKPVSGAYYIAISPKKIGVASFDEAGLFYAMQTLSQIIDSNGQIPVCEISDWPDVPFRGTVEGFYGAPWKHSARLSQIEFYGKWKLNAYIYGPKDDPFHGFGNRWRDPYPADKAAQIKELAETARKNYVNFIWAVHPGNNISWTDNDGDGVIDDFKACIKKFEMMYALGVRAFAVFFDDIGGEGAKPERQVEMLNYINREFIKKKNTVKRNDVAPLVLCPTEYAGTGDSNYRKILGEGLDKDISVMWTGPGICSDIPAGPTQRIGELLKRPPFIWWNWPVVDYCRTALLLGRTYGVDKANKDKYAGFVSNPMDKPEASKIALFGVAAYTWNMDAFDSEKSWKAGIRLLFPTCAEAMQKFANHNSDQGPNGHGYRRLESEEFEPVVNEAKNQFNSSGKFTSQTAEKLLKEFSEMTEAGNTLLEEIPKVNRELFMEIEFWIRSFAALGEAGTATVKLVNGTESPEQKIDTANQVLRSFQDVENFFHAQKQRAIDNTTEGDKRWSNGCKSSERVVAPFIRETFKKALAKNYSSLAGKNTQSTKKDELYKVITSVQALKNVGANRNGIYVNFNRVNEVITLEPNDYLGLMLPEGVPANYVHIKLNNPNLPNLGKIQVSLDGQNWADFNARSNGEEMQNPIDAKRGIKAARYINTSGSRMEIKINQFKLDVPADAFPNRVDSIVDGDPESSYSGTFSAGQKISLPAPEELKKASKIRLYTSGKFSAEISNGSLVITSGEKQEAGIFEAVPVP